MAHDTLTWHTTHSLIERIHPCTTKPVRLVPTKNYVNRGVFTERAKTMHAWHKHHSPSQPRVHYRACCLPGTDASVRSQTSDASVCPPQQFSTIPKPLHATVWHDASSFPHIPVAHELWKLSTTAPLPDCGCRYGAPAIQLPCPPACAGVLVLFEPARAAAAVRVLPVRSPPSTVPAPVAFMQTSFGHVLQ